LHVLCRNGASPEDAEEIKQRLVASLGAQNQSVYLLEGVREVTANLISGAAWVITGNLAAPFTAAVLIQVRKGEVGVASDQGRQGAIVVKVLCRWQLKQVLRL
jgi:hypothetical protein